MNVKQEIKLTKSKPPTSQGMAILVGQFDFPFYIHRTSNLKSIDRYSHIEKDTHTIFTPATVRASNAVRACLLVATVIYAQYERIHTLHTQEVHNGHTLMRNKNYTVNTV